MDTPLQASREGYSYLLPGKHTTPAAKALSLFFFFQKVQQPPTEVDTLHPGRLLPTLGGPAAPYIFFLFFRFLSSFCFRCGHRPLRWTHRTWSGNRPLTWTHRPGDKATAHDRCTCFPRAAIAHRWWTHCSHIRLACRCQRVILHSCCVFNSLSGNRRLSSSKGAAIAH